MKASTGILLLAFGVVLAQDNGGCPKTGMKPYDYSQALCMSPLFYEAQRSGKLPADQRVTWRGDSCMTDGADVGLDLTGGYFDAGDFVKFGLPLSFAMTSISWGLIAYNTGWTQSGQLEYGRKTAKWGLDWMLRAANGPTELYGQVGNGEIDHTYWGRPEELVEERPSYKITQQKPGSDLAAETAAAFAAGYLAFVDSDKSFANEMLAAAREMHDFADQYRDIYQNSIDDAMGFYRSTAYEDELAWGALWLYKATGEEDYMTKAKQYVDEASEVWFGDRDIMDWDNKIPGVKALFAELDDDPMYMDTLEQYVESLLVHQHTPKGLVFMGGWGSLREAMGVTFIALRAASMGLNTNTYNDWAQQQIDYALGSTGRSFVCGFGVNPPTHVHHASSSCPDPPEVCDWKDEEKSEPNAHTLFGALVGGPDEGDNYSDDRFDYVHNEVAVDYNAMFTSVLAAMVELH